MFAESNKIHSADYSTLDKPGDSGSAKGNDAWAGEPKCSDACVSQVDFPFFFSWCNFRSLLTFVLQGDNCQQLNMFPSKRKHLNIWCFPCMRITSRGNKCTSEQKWEAVGNVTALQNFNCYCKWCHYDRRAIKSICSYVHQGITPSEIEELLYDWKRNIQSDLSIKREPAACGRDILVAERPM